jgi:hypothetical protein
MASSSPSALVTNDGASVLLRLEGHFYELSQAVLRQVLGLPEGPPGLGITIDRGRLHFEFADDRALTVTSTQLRRRLAKRLATSI